MANAILDLMGSPALVSLGTKNLVIGTNGVADIVFVTAGVERLRIDSAGQTTLAAGIDFRLANNDWLEARNAAGNADLLLLKADSSDNTVLNALTGKSILLDVNATAVGAVAAAGLIMGGTSVVSGLAGGPIEVQAAGDSTNAFKIIGYSTTAGNAPAFVIGRTKGATAATNTIVASGDTLASMIFAGANGTDYNTAAEIKVKVDGTPGATTDMPGRFEFYTTPDGSGTQLRRWVMDALGALNQDVTNGSNIVLTKASTSVCQTAANAVSGAGTTIADATQLTAVYNRVSTVASGTGVKAWDATIGTTIYVVNLGANDLEFYPPDTNGVFNSAAAGVAVTLAAATNQIAIATKTAANTWFVMVGAGPDT